MVELILIIGVLNVALGHALATALGFKPPWQSVLTGSAAEPRPASAAGRRAISRS